MDVTGRRSGQVDLTLDGCGRGWTTSCELENRWGRKVPRGSNPRPSANFEIELMRVLAMGKCSHISSQAVFDPSWGS